MQFVANVKAQAIVQELPQQVAVIVERLERVVLGEVIVLSCVRLQPPVAVRCSTSGVASAVERKRARLYACNATWALAHRLLSDVERSSGCAHPPSFACVRVRP